MINDVLQRSQKEVTENTVHSALSSVSLGSNHEGNGAIKPVCGFPLLAQMKKSNEHRRQMFPLISL